MILHRVAAPRRCVRNDRSRSSAGARAGRHPFSLPLTMGALSLLLSETRCHRYENPHRRRPRAILVAWDCPEPVQPVPRRWPDGAGAAIVAGVNHPHTFMRKLQAGEPVLGAAVSVSDPTITEALADSVDFVWIDQEHNPLSVGEVQGHIMATKGAPATPIVRVPWNDHVMIKRVLDAGAAGIIVPMVRTAAEARRAVEACLYPPEGIRGYGPRRPSNYGRRGGVEFVRDANASP